MKRMLIMYVRSFVCMTTACFLSFTIILRTLKLKETKPTNILKLSLKMF